MTITLTGPIWYWKGPAPHYFVTVPPNEAAAIKEMESLVTYGWGMIPCTVQIGNTRWKTSLWPKDGLYIVPLKASVRETECLNEGERVIVILDI